MLKVVIVDGNGNGTKAAVNSEGELTFVQHQHPPREELTPSIPFRQYFTDNGTSTGDNNMAKNGATTPLEYSIKASDTYDTYIKTVSIEIADAISTLNQFGNIGALSNTLDQMY